MNSELEQLNQRWTTAWLEHDAELVESMMAPEYVYIAPNGKMLTRDQILDIVRSPDYRLLWGGRSEVSITAAASDIAIVVSRWRGQGKYQGQRFRDDHRCTSTLVRRAGQWLLIHEHCSAIAN